LLPERLQRAGFGNSVEEIAAAFRGRCDRGHGVWKLIRPGRRRG
jgi:hypothetical protein